MPIHAPSSAHQPFSQRRKLRLNSLSKVLGEVSDEVSQAHWPCGCKFSDFPLHRFASDSHVCGILQLIKPLLVIIFIELLNNPV